MENDERLTEADKEIMRNLDITSAVMNLRKFKKMVKSINLMNNKEERHEPNTEIHDVDAETATGSTPTNSTRTSHERSRSVVQERRHSPKPSIEVIAGPDKRLVITLRAIITTLKMTIIVKSREIARKIFPAMRKTIIIIQEIAHTQEIKMIVVMIMQLIFLHVTRTNKDVFLHFSCNLQSHYTTKQFHFNS